MTRDVNAPENTLRVQSTLRVWWGRVFVRRLIVPGEHGAWAWFLVPFGVGLASAASLAPADAAPRLPGLAVALTLAGGLAAFLMRQPATAWLRLRRGRGRPETLPLARGWTLGLAGAALLCFAGLLALGRGALWGLVGMAAGILALYLYASQLGRAGRRALWMEVAGAAGLSLMAPGAVVAVTGALPPTAWRQWGALALLNALAVLYVRRRLADTARWKAVRRDEASEAAGTPAPGGLTLLLAHGLALVLAAAAALAGLVPALTVVPFAGLAIRAAWVVRAPRPVPDVRRFGFLELAVALVSGAIIAASYYL